MALLSRLRALRRGESSAAREQSSPQLPHSLPVLSRLGAGNSPTPDLDGVSSPSRRFTQLAQDLRISLPSTCHWLEPADVDLIGERPMAAGEFSNIWEGTHDGRKVVLKSHCCATLSDATQVIERFLHEVRVSSFLNHMGAEVVPLVGVYSTEAHPFCIVYEYLDGLDVKKYMKGEPNADKLELLVGIARGLNYIHDLGIVHGNIQTTNVLVNKDGTAWIAGLGNASILSHSTAWMGEDWIGTNRFSRSCAPEMTWPGGLPNQTNPPHPTTAIDMYAFGVMTWEILTGQPPFSEMTEIAAACSMLSGARPPRPSHREISDRMWHLIERCWDAAPSRRVSAGEAIRILEAEIRYASDSCNLSHT